MRAQEFITEVFNSNVPQEVVRATSDLYTTKATIGKRTIVFNSSQYDNDEGKSVWEIEFTEKDETGTTFRKTGSGSELQVFSFVVQSIKDLIAIYHPDQLTFTSHKADDNRTTLYQRMLSRVKVPGYHAAPVDSGEYDDYFKIVKDNLSEDDGPIGVKLNDNSAAKEWIKKVYEMYPQTWQNNHVMPMGGSGEDQQFVMFELTPSLSKRDAVEVKWFQAFPLRQGVGGRAMRVLQDLAKNDGIGLTLFPWQHGQVSQAKLMKFYKGTGFKPTAKGAKSMAWDPSINENKTTVNKLYAGNFPGRNESFWDEVRPDDFDMPLEVKVMSKHMLSIMLQSQYRVEHLDEILDMMDEDQQEILQRYMSDPNLSNKVILVSGDRIIDGNHRALAAAMKGVPIHYVDLEDLEDQDDLDEIKEAFDISSSFPIEEWYEEEQSYAIIAVAHDSEGREIEVIFTPLHDDINAIDFDFTRGGTYEKTGEGDATKVFATVLNAFTQYLKNYNDPDIITFGSKGDSRTRLYQAMIARMAGKFGYKQVPYNSLPKEITDQPTPEGQLFALVKA